MMFPLLNLILLHLNILYLPGIAYLTSSERSNKIKDANVAEAPVEKKNNAVNRAKRRNFLSEKGEILYIIAQGLLLI